MRRLYSVLANAAISLILWLATLLVLSVTEMRSEAFKANPLNSYTFFVFQMPLYCLVLYGSYSLCDIGYHLIVLGKFFLRFFAKLMCVDDCHEAHRELLKEIEMAKADLTKKGVKL